MQIDRDDDPDTGADVFWPGYVDAVTNLVLNLLFVVVIMTVAVFIFAMELGRQHSSASSDKGEQNQAQMGQPSQPQSDETVRLRQEIAALQAQLQAIKPARQVSESSAAPGHQGRSRVVEATTAQSKPVNRLDNVSGTVIVDFTDEAVTLSSDESARLRDPLGQIVAQGRARVEVKVPPGFTESRRLGFYRAMAVRNQLMELGLPKDRIEMAVSEGSPSSDATLVVVSVQR